MRYVCTQEQVALQAQALMNQHHDSARIVQALQERGARVLLVGGAVRDMFLRIPVHDIDIEVYGIAYDELEALMQKYGVVRYVGKSFGVLRIDGVDVDWSLPRIDSSGRKPLVQLDPDLDYTESFKRRDLTMNAIGIDLATYSIVDPYHGQEAMRAGILRATDPDFFVQDPLRLYRVMQFVSRFGMYPDEQLAALCKAMDVSGVSRERIEMEFDKMLLRSHSPSLGLRWLAHLGILPRLFPELAALQGVAQQHTWHPEGDVFEHTMQALDAAARLEVESQYRRVLLYAVLCHDLGKATTTGVIDGNIRSFGHEKAGVALASTLLKRITKQHFFIRDVETLVYYHMRPGQLVAGNARLQAYKRLAHALGSSVTLQLLAHVAMADRQGRNGASHEPLNKPDGDILLFIQRSREAGVLLHPEKPLLSGRDLLDVIPPGAALGKAVAAAYTLQLQEQITDKTILKERLLQFLHITIHE
jgi:tRNA nucleotidyltransferase (CCA-adding enzyme)